MFFLLNNLLFSTLTFPLQVTISTVSSDADKEKNSNCVTSPKQQPKSANATNSTSSTQETTTTTTGTTSASVVEQTAPNILVYKKMEKIVEKMQAENGGVNVRTVKGFMSKIPSVFSGADLITWILKNVDVDDTQEAIHIAHLLASHGYLFPIDDHYLTVKNDNTFYRFQTPYFWPSNCYEPENTDYAVYLCKRTMQNKTRLELADYEAENLAKLQKLFSRKWEFIYMQAEGEFFALFDLKFPSQSQTHSIQHIPTTTAQSKVDKKRDKLERKVLDSQERAFWDVFRPMPNCINTTEVDIKKAYRKGGSTLGSGSGSTKIHQNYSVEQLTRHVCI